MTIKVSFIYEQRFVGKTSERLGSKSGQSVVEEEE
jgi:hypothetical protein